MAERWRIRLSAALWSLVCLTLGATGCVGRHHHARPPAIHPVPRELDMVSHPSPIIEPGDSLVLTMLSLPLPKPPYRLRVLDEIYVVVPELKVDPIDGAFTIGLEGTIQLPPPHLTAVRVQGLSLEEAGKAIEKHLREQHKLKVSIVIVALSQAGREFPEVPTLVLVRPDGIVNLGAYGLVHVAGRTEAQARDLITEHLSEFLLKPELLLELSTDNYKSFYLIIDNPETGETLSEVALGGKDTVLKVISAINGIPLGASRNHIWIARPAPADAPCDQILEVDWAAITQRGSTVTNYQLLPGDRLYIKADPWIALDRKITKVTAPFVTFSNFVAQILGVEEQIRAAASLSGGLFSGGFFGFGFPGFGTGF